MTIYIQRNMKQNIYKSIFLPVLATVLGVMAAASCDTLSSSNADPVVRFVRPVDPVMGDKLLTEVSMGATIAVIGEGLGDVCKIAFNDQYAKLNPTLVTPTSIIVTVPSTMPETVTDKIYLETSSGKHAEYDLSVIIPSPSITSIACEYAPAGSEVSIYGKYFFPKEDGTIDVVFPGNVKAEVTSVAETEIVCVVPEGATIEGQITVTSAYGTSKSAFNWRSTEGLFLDFETTDWNLWGLSQFGNENGCSGQYLYLSGSVGSWSWPDNTIQLFFINPSKNPLLDEGEVSDYALSFEYCCNQWDCTQMIMWFNGAAEEHNVDGTDAQYHWKLFEEGFDVGQWRTVTIPLSDFNTNKEDTETRNIASFNDMINFHMMPFGAADGAGTIDIKLDNFRLVKIQ